MCPRDRIAARLPEVQLTRSDIARPSQRCDADGPERRGGREAPRLRVLRWTMPVAGLLEQTVEIPGGVEVGLDGDAIVVSAKGTTLRRKLSHPRIQIVVQGKQAKVRCEYPRRREGALVGTFAAHLRNMIVGVTEGYAYEMKIVYSHFPVKATVKGPEFIIENFLGEKFPRKTRIVGETKVEVKGDQVLLSGPDVEAVGQTAANIELATRIRGFDPRIFQDGIYITKKAGEEA